MRRNLINAAFVCHGGSVESVGSRTDPCQQREVAVGSPNNTSTSLVPSNAGIVRVFSAVNPDQGQQFEASTASSRFTQNTPNVETAEANDHFGAALAAKDFNGDGASDLAIGAPGESTGSATGNGEFHVIYGLAGIGLSADFSTGHPLAQTFTRGGISGAACGATLSAWNFGKSTEADLAIGVPFDNPIH
jgi:FG-GAP repeat